MTTTMAPTLTCDRCLEGKHRRCEGNCACTMCAKRTTPQRIERRPTSVNPERRARRVEESPVARRREQKRDHMRRVRAAEAPLYPALSVGQMRLAREHNKAVGPWILYRLAVPIPTDPPTVNDLLEAHADLERDPTGRSWSAATRRVFAHECARLASVIHG